MAYMDMNDMNFFKEMVGKIQLYDINFNGQTLTKDQQEIYQDNALLNSLPGLFKQFFEEVPLFNAKIYVPLDVDYVDIIQWTNFEDLISKSRLAKGDRNTKGFIYIARSIREPLVEYYFRIRDKKISVYVMDHNNGTKFEDLKLSHLCTSYNFIDRISKEAMKRYHAINEIVREEHSCLKFDEIVYRKYMELNDMIEEHSKTIKEINDLTLNFVNLTGQELPSTLSRFYDKKRQKKLKKFCSEIGEINENLNKIIEKLNSESWLFEHDFGYEENPFLERNSW
ncbi:hypothetical protein [Cytobacillus dafuensis]|uniref:Uncharacterized protein n=1 Tax=Cytobacillus dafuensis TaxID=1742359 RepID=A0A5B8Z2G3_CYTDA|nr:hypothetical protein [Cytobacillus dafuensis]QED47007.1 hypothetical protein FSZ17_06990 [Cytobacillus dafuensis]